MELLTRPAKKCNLDVLHNLTLKHLIAVLGFRALVSYCYRDWVWLLSGGMCDCRYSVTKGNSLGGLKSNSCKLCGGLCGAGSVLGDDPGVGTSSS